MKKLLFSLLMLTSCVAFTQPTNRYGKIITNKPSGGTIIGDTLKASANINLYQTTAGQTITLGAFPDVVTKLIYVSNTGTVSVNMNPGGVLPSGSGIMYRWDGVVWSVYTSQASGGGTASNGLTNVLGDNRLGGTLTSNTDILGAGRTLKLGTSASKLSELWGHATDVVSIKTVNNGNKEFYSDPYSIAMYYTDVSGSTSASVEANSSRSYINWDNGTLAAILSLDANGVGISTDQFATYYAFLKTANLTANRTYQLPNASGDLLTNNSTATLTNKTWNGSVIGAIYGGAGTINGLLKANGSGTVSAAVAGTDYVAPGTLGSYLPLSGGTMTGDIVIGASAKGITSSIGYPTEFIPFNAGQGNYLRSYSIGSGSYSSPDNYSRFYQTPGVAEIKTSDVSGGSTVLTSTSANVISTSIGSNNSTLATGNAGTQMNFTDGSTSVNLTVTATDLKLGTTASGFVARFRTTNITTGDKIFELPNISGDLLTNNSTATLTNKTWNGSVIGAIYGGAGTINGLLKANGSGTVSAAIAGTDYVTPGTLGSYLPLSGGTMTGDIIVTTNKIKNNIDPGNYLLVGASNIDLMANSSISAISQQDIELTATNSLNLTGSAFVLSAGTDILLTTAGSGGYVNINTNNLTSNVGIQFPNSGGVLKLAESIESDATDANFTAVVNSVKYLPVSTLTANRTITIPTGNNGDFLEFYNNETAFIWNLSGAPIYLSDGTTTITSLYANTNHLIRKVSGKWRILN